MNVKAAQQVKPRARSIATTLVGTPARAAGWSAICLWVAQPPLGFWPLILVALTPLLELADSTQSVNRRDWLKMWLVFTGYWMLSLQGLRHAHPVMYLSWGALASMLAVYPLLFVFALRRLRSHPMPLLLLAPVVWVGLACLRNYFATGISVLMLGHALADVPTLVQVADLGGTYAVSFLVVVVNVVVWLLSSSAGRIKYNRSQLVAQLIAGLLLVGAAVAYGRYRLSQPLGEQAATFALIQRNETVEYVQSRDRSIELFDRYADESVAALRTSSAAVDAVVWPESMFTGAMPWRIAEADAVVPASEPMSREEFQAAIESGREYFLRRADYLQRRLAAVNRSTRAPELIVGCAVERYGETREMYSGIVEITPDGRVGDWYAKNHLVLIGEYVPLVRHIPPLRELIPSVTPGRGPSCFDVAGTAVAANICIETAVERVTVNHIAELRRAGTPADVVVTVTNDGWFDDSSVIEHHLRCAQLVAVACRSPILSAANNGPTAWIDSRGQIVERLPRGANGSVFAKPQKDDRQTVYETLGDWPARLCLLLTLGMILLAGRRPN